MIAVGTEAGGHPPPDEQKLFDALKRIHLHHQTIVKKSVAKLITSSVSTKDIMAVRIEWRRLHPGGRIHEQGGSCPRRLCRCVPPISLACRPQSFRPTCWAGWRGSRLFIRRPASPSSAGTVSKILPLIPTAFCDLLMTDPPYGINLKTDNENRQRKSRNNYKPVRGDDKPFDPSHMLCYPAGLPLGRKLLRPRAAAQHARAGRSGTSVKAAGRTASRMRNSPGSRAFPASRRDHLLSHVERRL